MEFENIPIGKIAIGLGILQLLYLFAGPTYSIYSERMRGQAELAHAQYSKEVAVAEARAKLEAAEMLAQAEVKRAEGVAKANAIIGESLKGNDAYLRYLWIQNLEKTENEQIIYIPTEAGLPILEAGRLNKGVNINLKDAKC